MSTDLHIHTNLSDGRMSPTEVIEAAIKVGCDYWPWYNKGLAYFKRT